MKIINLIENTPGIPLCGYEHGLSFYIETKKHKLLVDSGATDLFLHNAAVLGIDLQKVDTMILSHGHYDHAGGIPAFSKLNPDAAIYMRDSCSEDYYHVKSDGVKYIGIDKEIMKQKQCILVHGDLEIDDELFLFTNVHPKRYPAKGNLSLKKKIAGEFVQDTFCHEQSLVVTQGGMKILLSGCAHSGILDILDRYVELFKSEPDMVISGFHLMQETPYSVEETQNIKQIAHNLAKMRTVFYTGHCTGKTAFDIMKEIMGEGLQKIHSGETLLDAAAINGTVRKK